MADNTKEESSLPPISRVAKVLRYLKKTKLAEIEFVFFAFAMILGNRSSRWNGGLVYGYPSFAFNLMFVAAGYLALSLCMGEMTSALPFSGGTFGFVRAALGPYLGFMVACCEFVYCTSYTVMKVSRLLDIPSLYEGNGVDKGLEWLTIVSLFIACFVLSAGGGRLTFTLTNLTGAFILILLLIYLFGTLGRVGTDKVNFTHYSAPVMMPMTWDSFMRSRSSAGGQFNGMQYFPLLSSFLKDPKEQIPRLILIILFIFVVLSMLVTLAAICQDSHGLSMASAPLPMIFGLDDVFHRDFVVLKWLDVPCQFGAIFGLYYCSGKQIHALTKSGLMPTFLDKTVPVVETPYLCFLLSGLVGMSLSIFAFYHHDSLEAIQSLSLIATFISFIVTFIAYIVFRRKFSSMQRSFVNPLGDFSAIFGIINYLLAMIGIVFYSEIDQPVYLIVMALYFVAATIFFWTYLVKNQKFSEEEKKLMFKAYLINANRNARLNRLKNNKVGPMSGTGAGTGTGGGLVSGGSRGHEQTVVSKTRHVDSLNRPTETYPSSTNLQVDTDVAAFTPSLPLASAKEDNQNNSLRAAEKVSAKGDASLLSSAKMSSKVLTYLSSKLNAVVPAMNSMNEEELREYERLAVMAGGGVLDESSEAVLQERYGELELGLDLSGDMVEGVERDEELGVGEVRDGMLEGLKEPQRND